jgi:hypothetical protein
MTTVPWRIKRRLGHMKEKLAERHSMQRWIARKALRFTQPLGFTILGDHFYEPVPNISYIQEHYVEEQRNLPGFVADSSWSEEMRRVVEPYIAEYLAGPAFQKYGKDNWYFSGWDAAYYYCLIRSRKPRSITEIGRGFSTWIAGVALDRNNSEGCPGELVSVDPYTRGDKSQARTRIITTELQHILPAERKDLLNADILFVDSSHVVKWGSDVLQLFETWIPNVAPKTLVHIHDLFTPYDYPLDWMVRKKQFWNEQYFFESFIAFN